MTKLPAAFGEAERRDPQHRRAWVVVVDGNNTQIEAVTAESASRGVTVTIVIHVLEYPWRAAWSFFGKGDPAAEEWVGDQARKILRGKAGQVAAGIRRATGADECARYLTAKARYLDYVTALRKGCPSLPGSLRGHAVTGRDGMDITGTAISAVSTNSSTAPDAATASSRSVTSSPQKSRTQCK